MRVLALIASFLICYQYAHAEVIFLKDGNVVKGKIIEKNSESLKIDIGIGFPLTYYLNDITEINADDVLVEKKAFVPAVKSNDTASSTMEAEVFPCECNSPIEDANETFIDMNRIKFKLSFNKLSFIELLKEYYPQGNISNVIENSNRFSGENMEINIEILSEDEDEAEKEFDSNGNLILEKIPSGNDSEIIRYFGSDNKILKESNFKGDLLNGITHTYYPTGQIKSKTNYVNGFKSGKEEYFDETGKLILLLVFDNNGSIHTIETVDKSYLN